MRKSTKIIITLSFGWVLLDALLTYFLKTSKGGLPPVNAILPFVLIAIVFQVGWSAIFPPINVMFALLAAAVGFSIGIIIVPDISVYRFVEIIGAFSVFLIGFCAARWDTNENTFGYLFLIITSIYVAVSILALLNVSPNIFPLINTPWAYRDRIVMRPEIMTDQNFQIFYLMPATLVLVLPYRFWRFWTAAALTVGGFFILAKLQTRSGMLALAGTLLLCILAPIRNVFIGKKRLLFLPLLVVALVLLGLPWIGREASLLFARFKDIGFATGYERLSALGFLMRHFYDITWWYPQGYTEYVKQYGTIAHSNITAMFLEGGILGLYMWIAVFLIPIIRLSWMFIRKQLDLLSTMILFGGVTMLIVQLSLNVPFYKQVWLWAGATIGALYRTREQISLVKSISEPSHLKEERVSFHYSS